MFQITGVKKIPAWIVMQQPSVKPSINFGHECGEVNRDWGYKQSKLVPRLANPWGYKDIRNSDTHGGSF